MDDPIGNFMAITGCPDEELAIEFLSRCEFDLGNAVAAYTADVQTAGEAPPSLSPPPPPVESVPYSVPPPASSYAEHSNLSYSGYTQPDRVASDFDPGVQLGMAPRNPFENTTHQRLLDLFAYPEYVIRQTSSLASVCTHAREIDRWVLVAIIDKTFQSACLPRDLWRDDQMKDLGQDYIACLEVNITTSYGERLANEYQVSAQPLPFLFIVNPLTTSRVQDIVLDASKIDAKLIVSQVLTFIADHGSPSAFAAAGQSDDDDTTAHSSRAHSMPVDVDVDEDASTHNTASPPREPDSVAPSSPEPAGTPDVVVVEPVSLRQYVCDDPAEAFRLRVRLPLSTLTLELKAETPAVKVMQFIAYSIHAADPSTYPVPPSVQLRTTFPPKDVTVLDESIPVSSWPGVRSGDSIMVRIT